MTQTSAPPVPGSSAPAPAAVVPAGQPPVTPPPGRLHRARGALQRTPGKMRVALVLSVLAAIVFGVLGFQAGSVQSIALGNAGNDASQLIDIQEARNTLVVADATATNSFLVGGLEPAEQRESYDSAIAAASALLTELAGRNGADAELLGQVSTSVTDYVELISQARANNRQGFPVGSAYLDQASTILRTDALPALDELVLNSADRVAADYSSVRNALWVLAIGLLCLAVLAISQVWLARRTHRVLNVGLVAASAVVLVVGIVGAVLLGSASSTAQSVRSGPYAATLAASQSYSLANDAKSMESFTLIKRGSGQAYEEAFVTATDDASERLATASNDGILDGASGDALSDWVTQHERIRELDDGGDWDGAVALAISTADGDPNAVFETFAQSVRGDISDNAAETRSSLSSAESLSSRVGWVLLAAGLLAAVLAWRGLSVRLEEYR